MSSFKFIHTADLHWGAHHEHPIYYHEGIRAICEAALTNNCECVLIAGDIFDKPNPNQTIKDNFVENILEYNDRLHFIIFVGNHDYTTKSMEYHSLNYLRYLDKVSNGNSNITVIEPGESTTITFASGISVYFFGMDTFGDLSNYDPVGQYRVLLWHGILPGIDFSAGNLMNKSIKKTVSTVIKKAKSHYFALGDIHKALVITNRCMYSGPPIQKSYVDSSGMSCITINGTKIDIDRVSLDLPNKCLLDMANTSIDPSNTSKIVKYVKSNVVEGDLVKIVFSVPIEHWATLDRDAVLDALEDYCSIKFINKPVSVHLHKEIVKKLSKSTTIQDDIKLVVDDICSPSSAKSVYSFCVDIFRSLHDSTT